MDTQHEAEQFEGSQDENCMKPSEAFYKTHLCFNFMKGKCRFDSCRYAHGMEELRHGHTPLMPTRSARHSATMHREKEPENVTAGVLQRSEGFNNRRDRVCYQWEASGTCSFGDRCRFPHGSQKHAKEEPKGVKNGDLYDWKKYPKPQPGWIRQTLNEAANPTTDAIVIPIEKKARSINKENSNAIHVSGCQTSLASWKWPQKITRIYGDWIDE